MIQNLKARLEKKEEGFTLVELLVVIVILGILAAIVVFAVGGITDKGDASATATDRNVLETAEEAYFANLKPTGEYTTEQGLVDGKFMRALSTKHDICVSPLDDDYEVVADNNNPATAACTNATWVSDETP